MEVVRQAIESATAAATSSSIPEQLRVTLLEAASKLVVALSKPEDVITKMAYQPSVFMATRTLVELGVFQQIVEKGSMTSAELAETTKADKVLLERLMRVVVASGFVAEQDVLTYAPNAVTKALSTRQMAGLVEAIFDAGMKPMAALPEYLEKNGYKNPDNVDDGPAQYGLGITGSVWSYIASKPKLLNAMHSFFEGDRGSRPAWVDWFPVQQKLLSDPSKPVQEGDPLYVDVAGGRGHDLLAFKKKFPEQPGKYYLFDLPHVVNDETINLGPGVEKKAFNFFEDQPISGARIYYMKFILHDWNDEKSLALLKNITAAMKKGYSTLIIEDFIIPVKGASLLPVMWDLEMMSLLAAMERTETQWRSLLEQAGLEMEGFYQPPGDGTGIIVTKLK